VGSRARGAEGKIEAASGGGGGIFVPEGAALVRGSRRAWGEGGGRGGSDAGRWKVPVRVGCGGGSMFAGGCDRSRNELSFRMVRGVTGMDAGQGFA